MDEATLFDALDGLKAYDGGSMGSGIHDEALRAHVGSHLKHLPAAANRQTIARYLWHYYLCPDRLEQGYRPAEAYTFLQWLDEQGWLR